MTTTPGNDLDQFKLFGPDGRLIGSGSMSAVTEHILDSRARTDAIDLLHDAAQAVGLLERQQEEAEELRERQIHAFCDGVTRLTRRLDVLEAQREEQMRQDAEEEERRIQAELDAMPDPDDPDPFGDPATYDPSGELHTLAPSDPSPGTADQGNLPAQLQKGVPEPSGEYFDPDPDPDDLPETPKQRAPVAVSMMSEDD